MTFSFVQITDHHLGEAEGQLFQGYDTAYALRKVMRHIADHVAEHADFLLSSGDLVDTPSAAAYAHLGRLLQLQAATAVPGPGQVTLEGLQAFPTYFLPGNHDDREQFFRSLFAGSAPMPHMDVRFQHKGVQFICLDWGPQAKAVARPEMLKFLSECLQTGLPAIVLTHHHLVPVGCAWIDDFLPEGEGREAFWKIIDEHQAQILGIFSGHAHVTYERVVRGVSLFGLRSTAPQPVLQDEPLLCIQPLHYRLVTVQGTLLTTRIFEVPL